MKKNALISLYDKTDIKKICKALKKHNIDIISTGNTAKKIRGMGFDCEEISNITKFKEILEGRVKTLHHKIHASILFNREKKSDIKTFTKLKFPRIDFVIVNFYPFTKISKDLNKSTEEKIEMIDIGGPSMIRSASKNFNYVTTISSKKFYNAFINELNHNNGSTTLRFRKKMAENNFKKTSNYDLNVFNWFSKKEKKLKKTKSIKIKYGENHNQKSYFIPKRKNNIFNAKLGGKEIGYNNILDISDGLSCLNEFEEPTCVIIKHNNPCGVASTNNIKTAFQKAYNADSMSAYGGVVLLNRTINEKLALILKKNFFEIIVAPNFSKEALNMLKLKKNLILINSSKLKKDEGMDYRSVNSGTLYQDKNLFKISRSKIQLASKRKSPPSVLNDLIFAYKVAKHVKSNAIVLVNKKQTLGIGAGQMSRLDATRIAIMKYKDAFANCEFVCASDAFLPFTDNIQLLTKHNCRAIISPNGSKNDNQIINYSNKKNISLFFIFNRVFKH